MTLLQTYECRAELAELDGIDALGEAVEGDRAAFDGGLDDTYTLEVVDADGRAVFRTLRIELVALQTEVDVFRLVLAQVLDTRGESEDIKQTLVGVDLTGGASLVWVTLRVTIEEQLKTFISLLLIV